MYHAIFNRFHVLSGFMLLSHNFREDKQHLFRYE